MSSFRKLIIYLVGSFLTASWMSCITSWLISSLFLLDFPFFTDLLEQTSQLSHQHCQGHKENFQGYMEVMMRMLMALKPILVGTSPLFLPRRTRH